MGGDRAGEAEDAGCGEGQGRVAGAGQDAEEFELGVAGVGVGEVVWGDWEDGGGEEGGELGA
ncbi:hypothetical protein [Catenulispora rubra]|uniref:hypothetical protein n=1 Tax=Catenulispora rubra TaxID=280293 RepID=UPI00189277B2|nr:hypothetical protein [Catenulispora rubra]